MAGNADAIQEADTVQSRKPYPPELRGRLDDEIYQEEYVLLVEPDHNERIIVIGVDSRKWALPSAAGDPDSNPGSSGSSPRTE